MRAGAEEMRAGAASAMRDKGVGEVVRASSPWWGRPPRKLQNGDPHRVLVKRLHEAENFIGKIAPQAFYLDGSISDIKSLLPIGTLPMLALGALAHEPGMTYGIQELGAVLEKKWGLRTHAQTLRSSVEELIHGGFVDKTGRISPAGQQFLSNDEAWTPLQKTLSTVNEPQRQMLISSLTPESYPPLARSIAMTPAAQVYTALAGVGNTVEPLSSHIDAVPAAVHIDAVPAAVPASISGLLAIVNHLPGGQLAVFEKIFGCRLKEVLPDLVREGWLVQSGEGRWQVSSRGKELVMDIDRDPGGSPHADPTTKLLSKLPPEVRSEVVEIVANMADHMVIRSVN